MINPLQKVSNQQLKTAKYFWDFSTFLNILRNNNNIFKSVQKMLLIIYACKHFALKSITYIY